MSSRFPKNTVSDPIAVGDSTSAFNQQTGNRPIEEWRTSSKMTGGKYVKTTSVHQDTEVFHNDNSNRFSVYSFCNRANQDGK